MNETHIELPVDALRSTFAEALKGEEPVVVAAPTGSGKSTRLPMWMEEDADAPVLVVEPRRVACRALAQFLARARGEELGETVGYRVRFEERVSPRTRIVFVTPGVALNMLGRSSRGAASVHGLDHRTPILVDEFHERSWEVDLFTAMLRARRAALPRPRLVLCSATLELERVSAALGATCLTAQGRIHPVSLEYRGESMPSSEDLAERVARVVEALEHEPAEEVGEILVFLPGKREIEQCVRALHQCSLEVVAVHGGIPPRELTRAFGPAPHRRVFLATNVAETSLTLPGVRTVIDSGLVRMRVHQGGRSVLALQPIAAASMEQRAGRAGRVGPGRCIRLWSSRFVPEPATPPEIERVELDDLVLRAIGCGVSVDTLADLPWVTPPPSFALQAARERLQARGTVDAEGRVTSAGQVRTALPVSASQAAVLADPPVEIAGVLCDLVALLEVGRDLLLPSSSTSVAEARAALFRAAVDEPEVQLRCLWNGAARAHGLHESALLEARRLASSLRAAVGVDGDRFDPASLTELRPDLVAHLLRRLPEAAFVPRRVTKARRDRARRTKDDRIRRAWGNAEVELRIDEYRIPGIDPELQPRPATAGVVLDSEWLGVGRGAVGVGRMVLRCEPADLEAAGIGTTRREDVRLERTDHGVVVTALVQRCHAGVVLSHERVELRDEDLCDAAPQLVMRGRLFKGAAEHLADALHHWSLIVGFASEAVDEPVPEPLDWVRDRLRTLGVRTSEDLSLVEIEDLLPDLQPLITRSGLSEREVARLLEDFPRTFSFPGGVCRVRVEPHRRLVVLEPERLDIKGDPPARYLPRFRGFAVELHKASRRQRLR